MAPRAAFVSFRFGATDGVSVVARTWMEALSSFGFEVSTVSGEPTRSTPFPGLVVPGLGFSEKVAAADLEVPAAKLDTALRAALDGVDLVVVENLLTIPMNLEASRATARVLAGRPTLVHHHDPPWHRTRFEHITELPTSDPAWRHVAITHLLHTQLAERSIESTVIYNAFAEPDRRTASQRGALRAEVRDQLDVREHELLVAHPVRAIERKNVPAAIELCERLGATYWLLGPPEEGYGAELDRLLGAARCRVVHRPWTEVDGIYAAADHVAFPSTWEGFGNPPIEAALHRRTVSVGSSPVAAELRSLGFDWFSPNDAITIATAMGSPDSPEVTRMLDHNQSLARRWFSLDQLHASLHSLLDEAGWSA